MKRVLVLIIIIFIALILFGCSGNKKESIVFDDNATFEEEEIKYEIEQIIFSKSFQSIEPSVEIITDNNKLRVLASLGLSEYSGVNVNKVVKKGSEVSIHVSGTYDKNNLRLAVPQVIMELKKSKFKKAENLKYNIIYDNYTPLKVKYSINDVLNKMESHFKISLTESPTFDLIKTEDKMLWHISYKNIFDRESPDIPLVNLFADVDANSGDIIKSEKFFISSILDDGHILNYASNDHLIYKKLVTEDKGDNIKEQLWLYNPKDEKKTILYSSNFKILAAQFNDNLNHVSVIEASNIGSELYIISLFDKKAYKVSFENKFNPRIMRWKDDKTLYLINNDTKESVVYSYNIENNETNLIGKFDKNIENLYIKNDRFLIVEKFDDEYNNKISITDNWKKFDFINDGFSPRFIDNNYISYIKKDNKKDNNLLIIYDLQDDKIIRTIEGNILSYRILSDNNIAYVKKDISSNNLILSRYSLGDKKTNFISNLISDKIYYDDSRNLVYLNIVLPFDNEKTEVFYSIDMSKLN